MIVQKYTDYSYSVKNIYKESIFDYRIICTAQDGTDKYSTIEAKISKKLYDRLSVGDIITVTYVKTYINNAPRTDENSLQTNFIIEGEWVDYNDIKEVYVR